MHAMIYNGFTLIIIPDPRDTKTMVEMIRKYKPNLQLGVPAQFMKLSEEDLKDISIIGIAGSAPLPETTQKEIEKSSGSSVMEGYGLSEMSPVTHLNTSMLIRIFGGRTLVRISNIFLGLPGVTQFLNLILRMLGSQITGGLLSSIIGSLIRSSKDKPKKTKHEKRGTIGILFPDTEVKLTDIETGKILTWEEALAGKRGEMFLKGPQRMLGYWPTPGDGLDKDGYVSTGDVVRLDENGYFYIVDRTKDMIIVSGFKVYSREVDDILIHHEGIEIAATVGIPDPEKQGSEIVVVFVQLRPAYNSKITGDDIKEYLRSRVAKYAVPKIVKIIDKIPLTPVEKVDKKKLREIAENEISVLTK
jgi:acyl-CoA synthetase (AMP-forming)/AMP-acid ligase II